MDIGTGKDFADYTINGNEIPFHLIDIVDAGYEYNVFEYQRDFIKVFEDIKHRGKFPIVCGGSGMYIEAILKGYKLINVPVNESLREKLRENNLDELTEILKNYKELHNTSDIETVKRAIRAIEIEEYYLTSPIEDDYFPEINSLIVGVKFERDIQRKRITERLKTRLNTGMIDEVKNLIASGVKPEMLVYYGLEYKYLALYVTGEIDYHEMFSRLETAIHQFAKRQMTWFRHMEKNGFIIHWLDGKMLMEEKIDTIVRLLE
jgi:tRNA dimethylallyltransferase